MQPKPAQPPLSTMPEHKSHPKRKNPQGKSNQRGWEGISRLRSPRGWRGGIPAAQPLHPSIPPSHPSLPAPRFASRILRAGRAVAGERQEQAANLQRSGDVRSARPGGWSRAPPLPAWSSRASPGDGDGFPFLFKASLAPLKDVFSYQGCEASLCSHLGKKGPGGLFGIYPAVIYPCAIPASGFPVNFFFFFSHWEPLGFPYSSHLRQRSPSVPGGSCMSRQTEATI